MMASVEQTYIYVGLGSEGEQEGHGLYRRPISGGSWELKTHGLPENPDVRDLALDPENASILLCGTQDGVYRTTNQADHWEKLPLPGHPGTIWAVNYHPNDPTIIYAGGEDAALYRTTNSGLNWSRVPIGNITFPSVTMKPQEMPKRILEIAVDPQLPQEIYAAIEVGGLIRSRDNGETWEGVSEGHYQNDDPVDLHSVLVDRSRPRHISIIARAGLFQSTDGGDHWAPGNIRKLGRQGTYSRVIRELPGDPSTIFIGGGPEFRGSPGALFKSVDYGTTWNLVNMGVSPNSTIFGFYINPFDTNQMFAGTRCGQVLGTLDGGNHWDDFSLPEDVSEINTLVCG
jgi:photosystem II stability/assembly factor-like uncharacterized protein